MPTVAEEAKFILVGWLETLAGGGTIFVGPLTGYQNDPGAVWDKLGGYLRDMTAVPRPVFAGPEPPPISVGPPAGTEP